MLLFNFSEVLRGMFFTNEGISFYSLDFNYGEYFPILPVQAIIGNAIDRCCIVTICGNFKTNGSTVGQIPAALYIRLATNQLNVNSLVWSSAFTHSANVLAS